MAQDTLDDLRQQVQQLQEEQRRLRDQIKTEAPPGDAGKKQENKPEEKREQPVSQHTQGFFKRHRRGLWIAAVVAVATIIAGYFLLRYFNSYASTDDAFIDGNLDPIGTRIAGTVIAVHVQNDQFVHKGEVLVELDPRDNQVAVEQARA